MQAHWSRMIEVEASVAIAFAERIKGLSKDDLETRLLASMTVSAMNVAIMSWYRDDYTDLSAAVEQVFSRLTGIVCGQSRSNAT
jgi:L-cysteine desulfidase